MTGAVVRPLAPALAPGSALAPIAGAVGGLLSPVVPGWLLPLLGLPGLPGSGTGSRGGPGARGPAVTFPGFDGAAAAGPDPLSTSSGADLALAALTAALLLLGLSGRGRARPDRSGVLSRSYLPAVSPA